MVKQLKVYERIKNNPKDVSKEELISVLRYFGCVVDTTRGKGGHFYVAHNLIPRALTVPSNKPIKQYYVKDCIKFIEEVRELER